jgi:MFS family permease
MTASFITQENESFLTYDRRVYPGWSTVIAGTIGLIFGPSTMTILTFGVFVRPLQQEFGWTLGQTTFAATLISYALVVVAPIQGILTDRYGGRTIVIATIPIFAFAYSLLYFIPHYLSVYYALWILVTFLAVGVWPLSYLRSTATWFDRRLGLALGFTNSGIGIGSIIIPPLAGYLVAGYGWRNAYAVLAVIAFVITWPIAHALLRDNNPAVGPNVSSISVGESSIGDAVRTSTFVITAIVFFVLGALSSGLIVLQVPMLIEAGISPTLAAGFASIAGASMIVGRVGAGYLLDYFHAPRVLACFIFASSIAATAFALGISTATAPFASALIGLIIGAEFDALSYLIPRYFGHRAFGKIYGTIYAIFQLGGGLGIAAIGFGHDLSGSFRPAMCTLAVLTILAGFLFLRIGPYKFPSSRFTGSFVPSDTQTLTSVKSQ